MSFSAICSLLSDQVVSAVLTMLFSLIYFYQVFLYAKALLVPSLLIIAGILLLVMAYFDIRKARVLASQGGRITVNGMRVTYPTVNKKKIEYESFLISDIEWIKDRDEDNQFVVQLPDKRVIFEIKYFDSVDEFDEFRELFG